MRIQFLNTVLVWTYSEVLGTGRGVSPRAPITGICLCGDRIYHDELQECDWQWLVYNFCSASPEWFLKEQKYIDGFLVKQWDYKVF